METNRLTIPNHSIRDRLWLPAAGIGLLIFRIYVPERSATAVGSSALVDLGFSLCLVFLVCILVVGMGTWILEKFHSSDISRFERLLFAFGTGSGVLAYLVFGLLAGGWMDRPVVILLIALGLYFWGVQGLESLANGARTGIRVISGHFQSGLIEKILIIAGALILLITFLDSLAPVTDYDGLMYHLPGPRTFLQEGGIRLLPEMWQANGPFTGEMLFTIGLVFDNEVTARLIHFLFACFWLCGIYALGKRFVSQEAGFLAVALIFGIPMIFFWAKQAYIEFVWCFYELLGFYAFLLWKQFRSLKWLVLTGVFLGFALGTKYLAVWSAMLIGLFILISLRHQGWKNAIKSLAIYGGTVFLVGSVWYVKNLILSGNPVYPLLFGGPGWDGERVQYLQNYLYSFGNPHTLSGWIRIIPDLFLQYDLFGTFALEFPGLLFPMVLLYVFLPKLRYVSILLIYAGFYYLIWTLGSQQVRFLMPVFPQLGLVTAYVLIALSQKLTSPVLRKILAPSVVLGFVIVTLVIQFQVSMAYAGYDAALGKLSKEAYLRSLPGNYPAIDYIENNLPADARVLMVGDGRGYYCDQRCLPDADQSQWVRLVNRAENPADATTLLREQGVTHLLYSVQDAEFFRMHDPLGDHQRADRYLKEVYAPACLRVVFSNPYTTLYELVCEAF